MDLPPECPNCGASVTTRRPVCAYCGTVLAPEGLVEAPEPRRAFGLRGRAYVVLGLAGLTALYALGWAYEDTRYWLDARAVAVWTAVLPLAALVWSACWAPRWGSVLLGVLAAALVFAAHLGATAAVAGRLQDDHAGIAAMVAGALLAGWLGGRGLRRLVLRAAGRRERGGTP